ncbi:AAA family ATPase [Tropicibacter alexandrii]|uniref:AAA family ATPase n=1 Tax=Tropicibacter alexandrii TaxID=2267683 RepID=UPI000EF50FD5|nr:AAA family ATPase [Tropicibacter alexandrii]
MRQQFRVSKQMRSRNTLTAAKAQIATGRKVILTYGIGEDGRCACKRDDCPSPGKHPLSKFFPNGVNSATDDIALVQKALRRQPNANLAISLAGFTVVDVDGDEGRAAVKQLDLPETVKVFTGRGYHLYFKGELSEGTFKGANVDVLTGSNKMLMVPPSTHPSGKPYRYSSRSPSGMAALPKNLSKLKPDRTQHRKEGPQTGSTDLVIKSGSRNDFFFRTACFLRRRFDDEDAVEAMLETLNNDFTEAPLSPSELRSVIQSSGNYVEDTAALFGPPKTTEPLPMEFLYYPYIPYFGVTLLAGNPGMGKSLLVTKLIAAVTSGDRWPLTDDRAPKGKVLLLSAEDNWQRVTLPRLLENDADIGQIRVMTRFKILSPENLEAMARYIEQEKPKLVVIDTLTAYMGSGRDMNRQNEVGEFLGRLTEIAEDAGCAVLAIGHLNKQSAEHPLYRIVGSIGFAASIRSALFYGTDPTDRSRFALAHGKANASELGRTMIFERFGGGRDGTPVLHPIEFSDANEAEVCRVETNAVGRPASATDAAREFILEFLSDQPVRWEAVESAVTSRSLASVGTLNELRAELAKAGEIEQVGKGKSTRWKLGEPRTDE